jgi:hypothetical protein
MQSALAFVPKASLGRRDRVLLTLPRGACIRLGCGWGGTRCEMSLPHLLRLWLPNSSRCPELPPLQMTSLRQ